MHYTFYMIRRKISNFNISGLYRLYLDTLNLLYQQIHKTHFVRCPPGKILLEKMAEKPTKIKIL